MDCLPNLSEAALSKRLLHFIMVHLKLTNLAMRHQDHLVAIMRMIVKAFLAKIKVHTDIAFEAIAHQRGLLAVVAGDGLMDGLAPVL
jgi:hypothetical protein